MLYRLLKLPAKIAFWMYCRQLRVNNRSVFDAHGPLLLACNHPNSFLDAIIISSVFKRPVYSLARGDAFANCLYTWILKSLKMFPVYRMSEGPENMEHNYSTFDACREIFRNNGIVLIFSEGRCINEWHLRPLKKGTARLAISAWKEGIDLTVLPVGINYQSFRSFGKNIHLLFGKPILREDIDHQNGFGKSVLSFNQRLQSELHPLVYEIAADDIAKQEQVFKVKIPMTKKILLWVPAILGFLFHWPVYWPVKKITQKSSRDTDHYDSILVGILFVSYPLYMSFLAWIIYHFSGWGYWWTVFILLPFFAWSCLQLKSQFSPSKTKP